MDNHDDTTAVVRSLKGTTPLERLRGEPRIGTPEEEAQRAAKRIIDRLDRQREEDRKSHPKMTDNA
jgi:hypothetical protein